MAEGPYRTAADSGTIVGSAIGGGPESTGFPNHQGSESGIRQAQAANDRIASGPAENGQTDAARPAPDRFCIAAREIGINRKDQDTASLRKNVIWR